MTYNSAAYPYRYYPYLQQTPSLGTGARVAGSISTSTRPKIGGIGILIISLIFIVYVIKKYGYDLAQ